MKKIILFYFTLFSVSVFAQQQTITYSVTPTSFEENQSITLTFNGSSINESTWGVTGNALYLWAWSFDSNDLNIQDCPTNGTWTNSSETNRLTYVPGNDTYTISFVPQTFYSRTGIGRIGFLVKAKNATGDKKSQDVLIEVGLFQSNLVTPAANSATIISSGGNLNITANNTNGNASYNLKANGVSINTNASTSNYSFNHTGLTANQSYELDITQSGITQTKKFNVIVNPGVISQALPAGVEDGINYNSSDATKATLVLDAPGKDFVYVAGSFNNWQPGSAYAMKKDATTGKFWLELTGLTSGQSYSYQYWVVDTTPTTNSPALVKTADPYSTLVLSPFDDPFISAASYPNLPAFPNGIEREVTVLQTGQVPYNWSSATTNFVKPNKDNLVVYEVLVRDFDSDRNYQDLIDKIDYFKNLKINAIQLMPVMEYEGNESWGYNTSFHMALDKYYGTANKFKEFIDLCHQNGIAVILDVALNHAFGRNPMVRMWMKDADGDGWGDPAADNPYFNEFARHSYNVGSDFNHQQARTQYYTKRVIKQWIQEFKIDGFRWDLTKGFTQNCTGGDDACTNAYQADRVAVLKDYADYSWTLDNNHYAIFEHLGGDSEEQQWANYRIGEGKGIMMWGELTSKYAELAQGTAGDKDITRMGHVSRGFTGKRLIGYPESHDKERVLYSAFTFGNGAGAFPVQGNLTNTIKRMSAIGAVSLLIPGPKMIWHFAELGHTGSIFTCGNGTVNTDYDTTGGDCKLDTKPQPQWANNWLTDVNRSVVYNNWAKMIDLKKNNSVFNANYAISGQGGNNSVRQRIYLFGGTGSLTNVVILANFSVANLDIIADFPFTGTWHNLMDNSTLSVSNTAMTVNIESGGFRIFGNAPAALSTTDFNPLLGISLMPNPASTYFTINSRSFTKVQIYSMTGQLVRTFENQPENYQYPISDLNQGVYFVKVSDDNNHNQTLKLIKQ
ncbi:alpha-amylase family glycosyl hydrolase [Flavobacterium sp.]|uniref:alpha-amylase family glycosyl hydrolase n=1 Tax=Flavobacterium sp. TaxID=239 RepID=UPI000EB8ACA2|nr:alpha-amylase family glycosyl hydrolase [Flavobacterium sp.]HCQ12477.1 alpha-amylase [Flavobacterium sp.]